MARTLRNSWHGRSAPAVTGSSRARRQRSMRNLVSNKMTGAQRTALLRGAQAKIRKKRADRGAKKRRDMAPVEAPVPVSAPTPSMGGLGGMAQGPTGGYSSPPANPYPGAPTGGAPSGKDTTMRDEGIGMVSGGLNALLGTGPAVLGKMAGVPMGETYGKTKKYADQGAERLVDGAGTLLDNTKKGIREGRDSFWSLTTAPIKGVGRGIAEGSRTLNNLVGDGMRKLTRSDHQGFMPGVMGNNFKSKVREVFLNDPGQASRTIEAFQTDLSHMLKTGGLRHVNISDGLDNREVARIEALLTEEARNFLDNFGTNKEKREALETMIEEIKGGK